jgi:hypothetical protein
MKRVKSITKSARGDLLQRIAGRKVAQDSQRGHTVNADEVIQSKRNISRFFVEQRHITWVMLIGVCVGVLQL